MQEAIAVMITRKLMEAIFGGGEPLTLEDFAELRKTAPPGLAEKVNATLHRDPVPHEDLKPIEGQPYSRVEITVAACLAGPDDKMVGGMMSSATLAIARRATGLPTNLDDLPERVLRNGISAEIGRVLTVITTIFEQAGWGIDDVVETPMVLAKDGVVVGHAILGVGDPTREPLIVNFADDAPVH